MKEISLKDVYQRLFELEKKIIMMRLRGNSYKKIECYAKKYDETYTIRRIRKLIDEVLHLDMYYYSENIYVKIFENLCFNESNFMKVFNEPNITYLFLKYRIKRSGSYDIPNYLYKNENYENVDIYGINVSSKPESIVYWILFFNHKNKVRSGYTGKEIYNMISKNISYWKYSKNDETDFVNALRSMKNAIEICEGEYIFFDNSDLNKKIKQFYNLLSRRGGIYNIDVIYKEEKEFYKSLGIESGISLHDIVNKYRNQFNSKKKFKILPYPNILFGYTSKKEFFKSVPKKYHNLSINEVINKLHMQGGVDIDYLKNGLKIINKSKITKDGLIKATTLNLTDRQINLIRKKLSKDYYQTDELLRIIQIIKPSASKRILETKEINRLGYKKKYNYFVQRDIKDIKKHIEQNILSNEFLQLKMDEKLNSLESDVVNSMIDRFKLIRISDNELITDKKLRSIGIYKKDLIQFVKSVSENVGNGAYFTVKQLFNSGKYKLIDNSNFDNRFYEELIKSSTRFNEVHIDGEILYCVSRKNTTRKSFIEWCLKEIEDSIYIDDVIDKIDAEFQVSISQNTVRCLLEDLDFYYDDTFEKIYRSKEYFLEEVFSNE